MKPTDQQREAIEAQFSKTLITIAGPGSGKTATTVQRIIRDQELGALPTAQVAVTFTNNAGQELRERLENEGANPLRHCGTLHAWAMREMGESLPGFSELRVVGDREYDKKIKETMKLLGITRMTIAAARELAMTGAGSGTGNRLVLALAIRKAMWAAGLLHPDLILAQFLTGLERGGVAPKNLTIYVDEYQDSASIDDRIYRRLRDEYGARLFLVGDPKQGIYGFRGASHTHLEQMEREAERTVELTLNFRSGHAICGMANRIADQMALQDQRPVEPALMIEDFVHLEKGYASAEEEALTIARWLDSEPSEGESRAVLTRYNQGVLLLAGVLRAHGHEVNASTDYEESEEDREASPLVACVAAVNVHVETEAQWRDFLTTARIPFATQDQVVGRLARAKTREERIAIVASREPEDRKGAVFVGTIHAAKGLEWDSVWFAGADDQAFDGKQDQTAMLAYVACTRARKHLMISHAASRQSHQRLTGLKRTRLVD